MAHMLEIKQGRASMFYVGETPWHKLGTKLDNPATAEEAIRMAGLDFTVEKLPNVHRFPDGREVVSHSSFFTYRTDSGIILGTRLGPTYTVAQNTECFKPFDDIVGAGEAIYHTAGVIGHGERIWILAKMPDYVHVRINGHDDPVDNYLLLAQSHDGSLSIKMKLTPIRVVCNNTLSAALNIGADGRPHDDAQTISVRHAGDVHEKIKTAGRRLGLYNKLVEQLAEIYNTMGRKQVREKDIDQYLSQLIRPPEGQTELSAVAEETREQILELVEVGAGSDWTRGTLWGAYNAVTEYTDHVVRKGVSDSALLKSIWFGGSRESLKNKAFKLAVEMLNN